jgi:transcriptional regulator with XRE-family HTH domain
MNDENLVQFGRVVRELRREKGLSQEAFADLAGVDRGYMGNIERGKSNLTLSKVFQISKALQVAPEEIFQRFSANSAEK